MDMKNISNDLKVGVFIFGAFAVLLWMSIQVGSLTGFSDVKRQVFHVFFNTISGVSEKSGVTISGVKIGEVLEIKLNRTKVRITIALGRDVKIPIDSIVTIQSAGLLGDKFINIQPGLSEIYVEDGGILSNSVDPTNIDEMMTKMNSVLDDVKRISSGVADAFGNDELGENPIANIMSNVDRATMLLREILEENRVNLRESISNVRRLSENMNGVIDENREDFRTTMQNFSTSSEKLDTVMASLESITGKIEGGEGTIGKLVQDDEIYNQLTETLSGAQETLAGAKGFVEKVDELHVSLGARVEHQSELSTAKSFLSLKVQPREDKFYLFEAAEDTRKTALKPNKGSINSLLYTLLVSKRYGDVGLRAGLIESSGGVGFDYYLWRDSLVLSADLFNFSGYDINAKSPQLKIQAKMYLQKYIYLYIGGDEMLNKYYRTFYGGVGIMVDEDDFKFFLSLL